jgi:signal transduction histidine kinase
MRADRDQLRQVLLNLVSNAYDAMSEGGLLVLEAESVEEGIQILVADTGSGIADTDGEHLFEPFFTTKAKGIGLGLAVAHRIVDEHGGSLKFTSGVGAGTAFRVTLPPVGIPAPAAS